MYALFRIIELLLNIAWWVIIIQAILSWLIAFNVINTYNSGVRSFLRALDRMTEPLYRPIRKILPDFGGLDFSPMIVLLLIYILSSIVVPEIFRPLLAPSAPATVQVAAPPA
ncbi:MAG TPA: YggT family protein [Allosphingosinicella sp.]|jgi:YggT family protein